MLTKFDAGAFDRGSVLANGVSFDDAARRNLQLVQSLDQRGFQEAADVAHEIRV
jgi:hypothetical protein